MLTVTIPDAGRSSVVFDPVKGQANSTVTAYANKGGAAGGSYVAVAANYDFTPATNDTLRIKVVAQDGTTTLYYALTVTVAAPVPVIATTSTIANGADGAIIQLTGTNFKEGVTTTDFVIGGSGTDLIISLVTWNNSSSLAISFTGIAAAGTLTIQAATSAFDPSASSASNALTITVPSNG